MSDIRMCHNCKHFGRRVYLNREPSGQCCKNEPDGYEVRERVPAGVRAGSPEAFTLRVIESPWPGVWPGDVCGEWVRREEPPPTMG